MSDWREVTIGELIDDGRALIQTGPFGSQLHAHDYVSTGIPVIPTEAIGRRLINDAKLPKVSSETARRLQRHRLRCGDILFARRGIQATGLSAIVYERHEGALCGTGAILLRIIDPKIDPTYVSFALALDSTCDWIRSRAVGAVMPNLNASILRALPLQLPEPSIQRSISSVLSSLDDKIALNRRMNHTLEATAAALFRSWFVDFDPVVAKAEGRRAVGVPADIHDALPSVFSKGSDELIPAGWEFRPIGELARVVGGTTPSTSDPQYWHGAIRWATPRDLAGLPSPILLETAQRITEAGLARISSGLLPRGTVLLSSRAPIGYIALAAEPTAINQGFIALVCDGALPNLYVLHWLRANMDAIEARANGTTFLEISKTNFRPIPAILPSAPVLAAFTELVGPLHERIESNERENRTLTALRDTLLPQLLSGAIRLRDAERAVGAAV